MNMLHFIQWMLCKSEMLTIIWRILKMNSKVHFFSKIFTIIQRSLSQIRGVIEIPWCLEMQSKCYSELCDWTSWTIWVHFFQNIYFFIFKFRKMEFWQKDDVDLVKDWVHDLIEIGYFIKFLFSLTMHLT